MSNHDKLDQQYAYLQDGLNDIIAEWRASLARKQERHGEKFNAALATRDLFARLAHADPESLMAITAAAIDRLAKMPDFNPVPDELAALDFSFDETDLEIEDLEAAEQTAPEGGAEDSDDSDS